MELDFITIALLLATGLGAGIAAGFIGIGGGVIMVPVLLELFNIWNIPSEIIVQAAMGTSLAVATLSVGSSAIRHHKQGNVLWKIVPLMFPTSMLGGIVASSLASHMSGMWLQRGLAFVLLLAAFKMILEKVQDDRPVKILPWWIWSLMGFGTGIFAGFSGLAGGLVLVPAMAIMAHVPTKKLAGTSSGVVVFAAFAAALGYAFNKPDISLPSGFFGHTNLMVAFCLALTSIPGAQLGAYLNKIAGSKLYKRIFGVLLIIVVIRLFLTS